MDKIKWIVFAVVVLGLLGGIVWFSKSNQQAASTFKGDPSKVINDGPIADHVSGNKDQKVILVEYGDYECPACGSVYSSVKDLTDKYQDKLTFVFRNFPLTTIHPNALAAATAAEAAGLQGKYWEMHDALYQNQTAWANLDSSQRGSVFESYAQQLGLDVNKFRQDLSSGDIATKIARDRDSAQTYNVDSTPTFVINGKKFTESSATDIPALTKSVEDALKLSFPGFQPAPAAS